MTDKLMMSILDSDKTRKDVAILYGAALRSTEPTNWKKVNQAITKRWSLAALDFIRNLAWRN